MNKKIKRVRFFYLLIAFIIISFTSCYDLEGFFAEDDGFSLSIRNYTDKEYVGCKFYMGAFDENDHYIAVDSLIYPNLVIHKNTEGTDINVEEGYSRSYPSRDHEGLNKYGYWVPKFVKIKEISGNTDIVFKFELSNGLYVHTNPYPWGNGSLSPTINSEGVDW